MDRIKVALIGLGGISQVTHIPILAKMSNAEITAVCDIDRSKTKNIAQKYNIKYYTSDVNEFFENVDAEILIIATPTYLHKEHAIKAFERGLHVLVEKPLARNAKEALEITEASEKYNKNMMVGMNSRFRPDIMMQESFISAGELGDIFYIKTGFLKKRSTTENWSLKKDLSGGGVVMDLGINVLDIILWLLKYPTIKSVSAVNYNHLFKEVEDSSFVMLKFHNNVTVQLELSWSLQREDDLFYCNVYGMEGSASINPLKIYKKIRGTVVNITPAKIEKPDNIFKSSYKYELTYMLNNLISTEKKNLLCSGREAVERMRIVDALYRSAKSGKEIIFQND